jgi:sugar phosphate isomerase/epimerase
MDGDSAAAFREKAEEAAMFVEGISKLPAGPADLGRFEAEMRTAAECGARVVRVVMIPGRRYERYASEEAFQAALRKGRESLALGAPAATRHGIRLAVENHNDQRIAERLKVLEEFAGEGVGCCLDCANSLSLLESPLGVLKAYVPFALSVHVKDIVVAESEQGFRYSDVALGDGFLDLERIVRTVRSAKPDVRFCLETITREPHDVPCLTPDYWSTLAGVPARDLARTLALVRSNAKERLPGAEALTLEGEIRREDETVRKSLAFARDRLGL